MTKFFRHIILLLLLFASSACFAQSGVEFRFSDEVNYKVKTASSNPHALHRYLRRGWITGDSSCALFLGLMHEQQGHYRKAQRVFRWRPSGDTKCANALLYLKGELGDQSDKDLEKALSLLNDAADRGSAKAMATLANVYEVTTYGLQDLSTSLACYRRLAQSGNAYGLFKVGLFYELGDGGLDPDSVRCIDYYRRAAQGGEEMARCYLADFYKAGHYLPLDEQKAFELYCQSARNGYGPAYYQAARCLIAGTGTEIDSTKAFELLKSASRRGVGEASSIAGLWFEQGITTGPQADSALAYRYRGSRQGNADCQFYIGKHLFEQQQYVDAIQQLYAAASQADYRAMALYSVCQIYGLGLEEDPIEGYQTLKKATALSDWPDGYLYLGICRMEGTGCRQNEEMAVEFLDSAATKGNATAMYELSMCLRKGLGCDIDTARANYWMIRSANAGYAMALNELGDMYEEGVFLGKNLVKAAECYQQGINICGDPSSYCNLGLLYENGLGVEQDAVNAFQLYSKAAAQGSGRGKLMVANCYIEGIGVEENIIEAIRWLQDAANSGNLLAHYNLGVIYENGGNGVPRDRKKAIKYYTIAAQNGYEPAEEALERMLQ